MGYTVGVQDRPPTGGFPETVAFRRNLPVRGPSGAVMFLALFGVMGYGWYHVGETNAERRELRREKAWARIHLVPLLQAETDRDLVRRLDSYTEKEAAIMSSSGTEWTPLDLKTPVKGVGKFGIRDESAAEPVYHTERYVRPSFLFLPRTSEGGDLMDAQWWRGTKMFLRNPPYHERSDFPKPTAQ